ncbi:MAG: RagB/SusD family nutrient uptake outer membrane protein [Bacteroidota bacterium]
MKKIIILSLSMVMLFGSCEDAIDLTPQQSLSDQVVFTDPLAAQGALIGIYNQMQDLHVFGSMPQIIADYATDNVNFVGTFTGLQEIDTYTLTAGSGEVNEMWRDTYEGILGANAIIANASTVPTLTAEEAGRLEGEARFIRAALYFQLINFFAQPFQVGNGSSPGVPLFLEPFTGEIVLLPRSTVGEVHQQIIADLDFAAANLPNYNEVTFGFASVQSAQALESRLRLYRGEFAEAAALAGSVIDAGFNTLAADYSFWDTANPEIIFAVVNTAIDPQSNNDAELGSGSFDGYYEGSNQAGRGDCPPSADLLATFEAGDIRAEFFEEDATFSGLPDIFTLKYDNGATDESDYPMIRISEIILTRAEALVAESGTVNTDAIALMNQIRERAGLSALSAGDFASGEELLAAIRNERRLELAFEGHRRMDLLRIGAPLRTAANVPDNAAGGGVGVVAGDDRAIYPLPQREIDLNEGVLVQNPGF